MGKISMRLVSLVIGIALSIFVNYFFLSGGSTSSILQIVSPVEVKNLPSDKVIVAPTTRQVRLTLQGPSIVLARVAASPPVVRINLPEKVNSEVNMSINPDLINLPSGVEVVGMSPSSFEFKFDNLVSRILPVKVVTTGKVPDGFEVSKVVSNPSSIDVTGPAGEVTRLVNVETSSIDLNGVNSSISMRADVHSSSLLSRVTPSSVIVNIEILPEELEKTIDNLLIPREGGEPLKVKVVVKGPRKKVQKLEAEDLLGKLVKGKDGKIQVKVEAPHKVSVLSVTPEEVVSGAAGD